MTAALAPLALRLDAEMAAHLSFVTSCARL